MVSLAYLIELAVAFVISRWLYYHWAWWAGLVAFPLIMSLGNEMQSRVPIFDVQQRAMRDIPIALTQLGYWVSTVWLTHINLTGLTGWVAGVIGGFWLMSLMSPRRWIWEIGA